MAYLCFSRNELYASHNGQFMTHAQTKYQPIFQHALQFIATGFKVFCLRPDPVKTRDFTIV